MKRLHSLVFVLLFSLAAICPELSANEGGAVRYFRHLVFNHDSPCAPYTGTYEIAQEVAKGVGHYEFHYDAQGRVTEIVNESPEDWRQHPLTHLGAYRTVYSYEGKTLTLRFYDKDGARVSNLRNVQEEVYTLGDDGRPESLAFFDGSGKPMESNWNIARYAWEEHDGMLIERRYNLKGELVPLSPYFRFTVSGLVIGKNGDFVAHYNLNENLEIIDNENGIACYKNAYANNGNLMNIIYYNAKGDIVPSPWKFAVVNLAYDENGNPVSEDLIDENGHFVTRGTFQFDASGSLMPGN
jgi:hypothetical protein